MNTCRMRYPSHCTGAAETVIEDFQSGPRPMCNPCAKKWRGEENEAVEAAIHDLRHVEYGDRMGWSVKRGRIIG